MDFLSWIANQLNITTIIAVAGFLISVITLIQNIRSKRVNIRTHITSFDYREPAMFFTMAFENFSELPIAITDIKFIGEKGTYSCNPVPREIFVNKKTKNNEVIQITPCVSSGLPIQISALGAFSGIILFAPVQDPPKKDSKWVTFEIHTNRRKAFRTTLELSEDIQHLSKTHQWNT